MFFQNKRKFKKEQKKLSVLIDETNLKNVIWETSKQSISFSCEFEGALIIIAKYVDAQNEEYYYLDGWQHLNEPMPLRIFKGHKLYLSVIMLYNAIPLS